jgi:RIO kinase 1
MQVPESLVPLVQQGVVDEVIRPLQSGKEAQIYLVMSGGEERVAKVYKEAQNRTFKNRAEYTEGRKVRNSRDQRAMDKRSRYGRAQDEAAWRSTEVDMIYRLRDAGVSVPTPFHFIDGVLIMELVRGADGRPAPRLGELVFSRKDAAQLFEQLLAEVVRMLCAGVVHGDLSDFNVLMGERGPVIIDFPQAVTAAGNQNARTLLMRDVDNLQRFVTRFAPGRPARPYAQEAWQLFERGELTRHTTLTGDYTDRAKYAGAGTVLAVIQDAEYDERRRRQKSGRNMRGLPAQGKPAAPPVPAKPAAQPVPVKPTAQPAAHRRRRRRRKPAQNSRPQPQP